jgi:integrase
MARGSIHAYRLADGSERWMVMYRTSNGVQRSKRGFKGHREAEAFLNQMMAAVDRGQVVSAKDSFAQYIDHWLEEHRPRLEPGTCREYEAHIERRLKPFFGEMRLTAIAPTDVRRYVSELVRGTGVGASSRAARLAHARAVAERLGEFTVAALTQELNVSGDSTRTMLAKLELEGTVERTDRSAERSSRGRRHRLYVFRGHVNPKRERRPDRHSNKTINNSLMVLRLALGHAEEDGLIARNPAASRPGSRERIMLPAEHREMDYLRLYEIPRYLDACPPGYRPLAEVLIACGLRISEGLALTFTDVDFDGRAVRVLRSAKREGPGSTKSDRFRSVGFGPRVQGILRDLRAMRTEHDGYDPTALLFVGTGGDVLERRYLSAVVHKRVLRHAGLRESLRLHDLRHTAAASWLACGLPLIYVQRQLGHASIRTTERTYGHLEESYLRGAAKRVEAAIWDGQLGTLTHDSLASAEQSDFS